MSNLIYGPDGNPIPQENEGTASQQQTPEEEKNEPEKKKAAPQDSFPKGDIPYPLFVSQFHDHYPDPVPLPQLPFIRNSLEAAALISGIVSFLMLFFHSYHTLFIMFGTGLAAIILAALSYQGYQRNRKVCVIALSLGFIGIFMFLLEVFRMMIIVGNPDFLKKFLDLYEQVYGIPDSPMNFQDLYLGK